MREVLKAVNNFKVDRRGWTPNMRGTSSAGRDDGGRSYVAWTVNRRRPSGRRRGADGRLRGGVGE